MKIIEMIIKIPEEAIGRLALGVTYMQDIQSVCNAINEGTILPKGHGELIDRSELIKCIQPLLDDKSIPLSNASEISYNVDCIPTIIEADKVESEEEHDD